MKNALRVCGLLIAVVLMAHGSGLRAQTPAQGRVTTPMQEWGHNIGDDYFLVNYQQMTDVLAEAGGASRRASGSWTSARRPKAGTMLMAIITSPANHKNLARYKEISTRLARAEGLTDAQAQALAKEGKSVVWIDGGLHATETLGAQQLIEHVYQMVSRTDDETVRLLDDVIQLVVLVNPDGMDLVSDWYMKHGNMNMPVMYNKYAGHDDNRDFYMSRAGGVDEHQPHHVPRVVPADHVQPPPDRARPAR